MNDDELRDLVQVLKNHTHLGRLSSSEVRDAIRKMEAKGYRIVPPTGTVAKPVAVAPSGERGAMFTTDQAQGNRQSVV